MKRVIRLGDPTDHGGFVTSAASTTVFFGKPVALIGDAVSCPRQGHTNCVIVECDPSWTVNGKGVALEGHMVSCGAVLISTMPEVGRSYEGGGASVAGMASAARAALVAANAAKGFDQHFQVVDQDGSPVDNLLVHLEQPDGSTAMVNTSSGGFTQRVHGDDGQEIGLSLFGRENS